MDEKAFASLYKSEKALISPKPYPQFQILQDENCFNPLIVLHKCNSTIKISAIEENRKYFEPLTRLRIAIESRVLKKVILALNDIYSPNFTSKSYPIYYDFLIFWGLFDNCQWFINSNPKDYPQDLICPEEIKPEDFIAFRKGGEKPKAKLQELFQRRQCVKMENVGSLRFENPFSQILNAEFNDDCDPFKNALICLDDPDFNSEWLSERKKHSPQVALPDKPCKYCKTPFSPNSKKQNYCSNTCRNKAYRDNKALSEVKKKEGRA